MKLSDAPDLLTVPEVAKLLRIGKNQAYEAVKRGDIPSIKIGKTIRIPKHHIANWLLEGAA